MPPVRDQALCIRVFDWSETSQTVSLFTKDHGMLRAVAKGAKRDNARFSGGLEVATRGELHASIKGGDTLALLTSWDLVEIFPRTRASLDAFYAAMALLDVTRSSLVPLDPHPLMYDALLRALRDLHTPQDSALAVTRYLWSTLTETGHRPELAHDVLTSEPLTLASAPLASTPLAFSPRLGGFLPTLDESHGPIWKVRPATLAFLRSLTQSDPSPTHPNAPADLDTTRRALKLLAAYLREVTGSDCPALTSYAGLTAPRPPRH